MPVSKSDAIAAAKALNGSVNAVANNAKFHDKSHWSKQNAIAALNHKPVCGYYWRKEVKEKWTRKTDNDVLYVRPTPKKLKQYEMTIETSYHPVDINDCWKLLSHALGEASKGSGEFREGGTATRFVVAITFPDGYGGQTLYGNGGAATACNYIAVAIESGGGAANAQIVTHFPSSQSYIDGKTKLV
ncbi:hypothetical protein RO575_10045 [Methylomonas sp. MO1]|uniref:hypothetical protein n=1 Tax=unclassified Methylomonas TaxID=2608980 RepID=UPI00047BD666|nr:MULTISPECIES: hypothetical protein [unclassified Methylomonas]MDT4289896.1 hypothetical protein [Methylomonas sp. MO1]